MSASNYARAGIATTRNTLNSIAAARDNAPRYEDIQAEGMKARAEVKIAGLKAKGEVARAKIKAEADIRKVKQELRGDDAIREGKRGVAKAGVVAAAGTLIGDAFKKEREPYKPDFAAYEKYYDDQLAKLNEKLAKAQDPNNTFGLTRPTPSPTLGGGSSTDTTGGDGSSSSSATPPPAGKKSYSQSEIQSFAINAAFTPEESKLVSRSAMGESSGNPMAFNGKGADQSYGLMQINMLGDMGPERRAQFGLTSNEQLYDPQTNMNAAYQIYKQQGWGAWGAYTNGSYLNY